ncbi:hypothetical protein [Streptomyces sp. NPDC091416]
MSGQDRLHIPLGQASLSTVRGPIWRITPIPLTPTGRLPIAVAGK